MNEISVTLTVEEWQGVLGILGEHPYRQVKPLIDNIQAQATAALQARANGAGLNGAGETHHVSD